MVITARQIAATDVRAATSTCSARAKGRVARCALPVGHAGYHETRIQTRLVSGVVAGRRYAWLDD